MTTEPTPEETSIWRSKHPCEMCGTGYDICFQGYSKGNQCCANCYHPGRWFENPYTPEEIEEAQREYVRKTTGGS